MTRKKQYIESEIDPYTQEEVYWVWEHGVYPRHSVLAGQTRRARIRCFDSAKEAQKQFPNAVLRENASSHAMNQFDMQSFENSPAPSWFNPTDAGEEW